MEVSVFFARELGKQKMSQNMEDGEAEASGMEGINEETQNESKYLDVQKFFELITKENQRRDKMLERIVQLTVKNGSGQTFQVMPDLNNSIGDFTGEKGVMVAKEWIENLKSVRILHR